MQLMNIGGGGGQGRGEEFREPRMLVVASQSD